MGAGVSDFVEGGARALCVGSWTSSDDILRSSWSALGGAAHREIHDKYKSIKRDPWKAISLQKGAGRYIFLKKDGLVML